MLNNIRNIIPNEEYDLLLPVDYINMYELGNKRNRYGTYKEVFVANNIDHISIDLNGKDGAIPLDLSQDINLEPRDIVTNIGTSEHVINNQDIVHRNIHNLSKYRILHVLPKVGRAGNHGVWHITKEFYEQLAEDNDYEIVELKEIYRGRFIACSYKKKNQNEFVWNNPRQTFIKSGTGGVNYDS